MEKNQLILQRFHSKSLLPYSVIELSRSRGEDLSNMFLCDTIMEWYEKYQSSYRFKEGEQVVHRDNLSMKMEVMKIDKEIFRKKNSDGSFSDKMRMKGIDCSWWI